MPPSRRQSSTKHRATPAHPERRAPELTTLTQEWWSSWRRANALGWDYLNAMSGLVRLNMDAFSQVARWR